LIFVAKKLKELTDDSHLVARLGGDEFVILKPLGQSALNISSLADEIVLQMQSPFTCDGKSTACSVSVGVAIASANMEDPDMAVANADAALYHAKAHGKGRWSFFTEEMHTNSIATRQTATDLLLACERNEFIPYFQPLIDARTGRIVCAEMLVRWAHPTKGILSPVSFLDTAANMGILKRVDEIIFSSLHKALISFDKTGVDLPRIAFNVSAARLADPTFIHDVKSSGIDPERLTVEILESVYLDRVGAVVRWTIDELNELGITIALDDFGTGHASVRGLLEIRPAILKIDRHFILPIVEDASVRLLVSSIIGIGKSLGMFVVAEGVETEEHARIASGGVGGAYLLTPYADFEHTRDVGLVRQGGRTGNPAPSGPFNWMADAHINRTRWRGRHRYCGVKNRFKFHLSSSGWSSWKHLSCDSNLLFLAATRMPRL